MPDEKVTYRELISRIEISSNKLEKKIDDVSEKVDGLDSKFATVERVNPLERLVYGTVSFVLLSVLGAVMVWVLK